MWWDVVGADGEGGAAVNEFAEKDALSIVQLVERDMAEQALSAWRSADARRGLADRHALIVHADALTRWSERLRMALNGEDYRDRDIPPEVFPVIDDRDGSTTMSATSPEVTP